MSGMYGLVFGMNPESGVILATLGLKPDDVGRFRDCHVTNGEIVVYTRMGGGNRGCWGDDDPKQGYVCPGCKNEKLTQHPNYLRDVDDEFDNTYATYFFSFPEEYADGLRSLDQGIEWNPDKRWSDMIDRLKQGREAG